jgi:DNA-binding phage protein
MRGDGGYGRDYPTMKTVLWENRDVVGLLRAEVARAGGQQAFALKTGVDRTALNKVLSGVRKPSPRMVEVLGLRAVFVRKEFSPANRRQPE